MSADLFAAALLELERELDWGLLGELHCHEGGTDFYPPDQIEAIRETGLLFAGDVADAVAGLGVGRSLYVGASVFELAPALCEELVLGRSVVLQNLPGPEADELNRALFSVAGRLGRDLPRLRKADVASAARERYDHVWITSVLTDPEAFPALHDELYGRGGELATGRGDRVRERREAEALVAALARSLDPPAVWSTTDEELPFARAACEARALALEPPSQGRLSAVVGDTVRLSRVLPA